LSQKLKPDEIIFGNKNGVDRPPPYEQSCYDEPSFGEWTAEVDVHQIIL